MCLAIQEMREESRIEGRNVGELEGAITFAKELGISREEVKKSFMVKYQKSEQETEELMKIYWKQISSWGRLVELDVAVTAMPEGVGGYVSCDTILTNIDERRTKQ